jgi:hypothetical protein
MKHKVSTETTARLSSLNALQTLLIVLVSLLLGVGLVMAAAAFVVSYRTESDPAQQSAAIWGQAEDQIALEYTTEGGKGSTEGVVNSPLNIVVRLPKKDSKSVTLISASVSVQLFDQDSAPAQYGGQVGEPCSMKPTYEEGVWICKGSVPGRPGAYHARVVIEPKQSDDETATPQAQGEAFEVRAPVLQAKAESGPPLASGYVFTRDSNLWLLSTDTKRQRKLTFYSSDDEYADNASWSPDGKSIAFAYSPKTDAQDVPASDIWAINPDGSSARQLVAHGTNESLQDPAWSLDGRYLYFTVESTDPSSTATDGSGVPIGTRHIDRLDTSTHIRTQWMPSALMPAGGDESGSMVYLEDVQEKGADPASAASVGQRLICVKADGISKSVLVNDNAYIAMFTPSISPDGKWVAFAAINVPRMGSNKDFDFFSWLGLEPEIAQAHGLPWEMFIVPTDGGKPIKATSLAEDQPRPAWLDNSTLAFMGSSGLYKLRISNDGKPVGGPSKISDGAPHGGLTWHGP